MPKPSLLPLATPLLLSLASACDPGTQLDVGELPEGGKSYNASQAGNRTPVELYGQLRVSGPQIVDENAEPVQLKGASSMWLNWENDGYAESLVALEWMRDNWHLSVFRAAMGIEPSGAYLSNPDYARSQITTIVENAIDAGVYVIIDWHDHNATEPAHTEAALEFFAEMAETYGEVPNVIYELFNEPMQVSWAADLKPYYEAVIARIREHDPDNLIILGTPLWSQRVDTAANDPIAGDNLLYTLHFYSCDHGSTARQKGDAALRAGAAVFVTEWGATLADGGVEGDLCLDEAQAWTDWMKSRGVSWTAWKLDNCSDLSCYFRSGNVPIDGGWTDEHLAGHGPFVTARMRE